MDMLKPQSVNRVTGAPHEGARKEASMSTLILPGMAGTISSLCPRAQAKAAPWA